MKSKIIGLVITLLFLFPTVPYAVQQVIDATNLVQNVNRTMIALNMQNAKMAELANQAKALGHDVQMILNLKNQIELAIMNLQNIQILIKTGKYKSIAELNNLCFSIQSAASSVKGIKYNYERAFPSTIEFIEEKREEAKKRREEQKKLKKESTDNAIAAQENTLDPDANKNRDTDIETIDLRSKTAPGIKAELQVLLAMDKLQTQILREIAQLLATSQRQGSIIARQDEVDSEEEEQQMKHFVSDWPRPGDPKPKREKLTYFP